MKTPITDITIRTAIELWLSDPISAELSYGHISEWDTSSVTDMSALFQNSDNDNSRDYVGSDNVDTTNFNDDISGWDTSSVSDMNNMFNGATSFNIDISGWDTSSVSNMSNMFNGATSFNQDIGVWNTTKVGNMEAMFSDAYAFNQNISTKIKIDSSGVKYLAWDTSSVTNMNDIFHITDYESGAGNFNNGQSVLVPGISGNNPLYWSTSRVTTMSYMFKGQRKFNQCISTAYITLTSDDGTFSERFWSWDTSSVTNMTRLLAYTENFNNGEIAGSSGKPLYWDTSNTTSLSYLFGRYNFLVNNNRDITDPDYSKFDGEDAYNQPMDTEEVTINNVTYTAWDTSKVTDMSLVFQLCYHFNQSIQNWDTSSVTNMLNMFENTKSFNQPIGEWNTSKVENMGDMFANASTFNQDIGDWDTSKVEIMRMMFCNAKSFNHSINKWSLESLKTANLMFWGAKSINQKFLNFKDAGVQFFGSNGDIETYSGNSGISVSKMFLGATSKTIDGNLCFLAGTPVLTDQGIVAIEKINSDNTINMKQIKKILSFTNNDPYMVMFKKNSLGYNIPSEDTIMSQNHGVYIRDHNVRAKALINGNTILKAHLERPPVVYNILLEGTKKQKIMVNNMGVETMCPKSYNKINGVRYLKSLPKRHLQDEETDIHVCPRT